VVVPIVAAALIIGGLLFAWFTFVSHRGPDLPLSIGGYKRITDAGAKANAREVQAALAKNGIKSLVGEYGRLGKGFSLTVFEDPPSDFPAFFQWADQLAKAYQLTARVDQTQQTSADGGITIYCAPVTGATSGSLCEWTGPRTAGIVFALGIGVPEAQGLTAEASQAIV
jgi:hypothetical protein